MKSPLEKIQNYKARNSEVISTIGRFARIYDPHHKHSNATFLKCKQGEVEFFAKVIRIVGEHRIDVDLLSNHVVLGPISLQKKEGELGISTAIEHASHLEWIEVSKSVIENFRGGFFLTNKISIDTLAPMMRGASHLFFFPEDGNLEFSHFVNTIVQEFESPIFYHHSGEDFLKVNAYNARLFNDMEESMLDIFAAFTGSSDLVILDLVYDAPLSKILRTFEKERNPSSTLIAFIRTPSDVFPIVESLDFGNVESICVIDKTGSIDALRTRSRVLSGDAKRAKILEEISAYREEKFETGLLGEPFDKKEPYPELLEAIGYSIEIS